MGTLQNKRPYKFTKTVTLSGAGAYSNYTSEFLSGNLQSVYLSISRGTNSTQAKVVLTTSSTQRAVLTIVDPSTLGTFYLPRPLEHGTTGNATTTRGTICLCEDRIKIKVSSSSGFSGQTVETRFLLS